MPRCGNCGKANRDGALYCQDCGHRLDRDEAAAPAGPAGIPLPVGPRPATGSPVIAGAGQSALVSGVIGGAGAFPAGARLACPHCSKQTPAGFAFCQHCGHRLSPQATAADPVRPAQPRAESGGPAAPLTPTPPGGVRPGIPLPERAAPFSPPGARPATPSGGLLGRLIAVRRDGTDGDVIPLTGESFDVGRNEGSQCFAEDPYLAGRHARFLVYGGVVRVRPLDLVNGVYLRLREPHDLQPQDQFYVGKELLRFEGMGPEERDPPSLVEHGVRLFGSAPRESWGRLRQLTGAGTSRDLWHLSRQEVVLGREEGDIIFPDDEFMSRRHALLSRAGGRPRLTDLNSSNGTYIRLRGERELRPSDVLRMGDQLLRFEP